MLYKTVGIGARGGAGGCEVPGDGEDDLRSLCSPLTSAVPLGDGGGGVGGEESEMGRMKKSPRGDEVGGSCTAHRMWAWRTRRRYINHAHFGRCPGASSPTFCLGRHNKTCSDLQSKTRRRALQSDCGAQRLFECARLERRILGVLRRTGACSSALPHTPTRRELFCRRIVGPEMARIGFERNAALEERVFTIAFLSLMDGLEPIHSRRERRVH